MRLYRVLFVSGLLMFLCIQPRIPAERAAGTKDISDEAGASLNLVWKRPLGVPVSLSSSPNGKYIVFVSKDGKLLCLGDGGKTVWKLLLPGIDCAAVGTDGSAIAFSYLNLIDTTAYFISPSGKLLWRHSVKGAVWSASASEEPGRFAVGTGERYCYIYTISERRHRYRRWKLAGVPNSIKFSADGNSVIFGSWQDAGVGAYSLEGTKMAWHSGKPDRLYSVDISPSGDFALVTARPNRNSPECSVHLKDAGLNELWVKEFQGYGLTADLDRAGRFVAVGYQKSIVHKDKEVQENHIVLLDRSGKLVWEKGGMFGDWNLLQACADGRLLLYDNTGHIYILSRSGKVLLRDKLPATVRKFVRIPSRTTVVISCGDGQLYRYAVR
ncbi:MAG: WD40 repeat domain-containing protein [Armatimonadota bacterium]